MGRFLKVKKYDHIRSNKFIKITDSFRSDKVWIKLDSGGWKKRNLSDESN